ncbi:MAG: right-handed parallel beta-helix repeat-containing protein [Smithellaceae bacterium]|nr:right-handed parallel beta-helix repeat-containing protein [Smithellaceae bacterium]
MKKTFALLFLMILGSTMISGCASISIPDTAAGKPPAHAASYDKKVKLDTTSPTVADITSDTIVDTTSPTVADITSDTIVDTTSQTVADTTSDAVADTTSDAVADTTSDTANEIDSLDYDLYVSVNGDDANPGTKSYPFRTIQKAADRAMPGDKIWIGGGTYKEFVNINVSGTAGSPIVFCGERGPGGEYKTIIDPSTDVLSGWVAATEVGYGVYKKKLGFEPYEMIVDGKRIGKINNYHMGVGGVGWDYLAMAADAQYEFEPTFFVNFWDGVECICAYDQASAGTGYTYIRFRNGDDPNNKSIRAVTSGAGISISNKSYITIRDLEIKVVEYSVYLTGTSTNNIIVENCFFRNGAKRVFIEFGPSDSIIRNNTMTMDYYAGSEYLGAGGPTGILLVKRWTYHFFKYMIGRGSSDDSGVYMFNPGDDITISGNQILQGIIGISSRTIEFDPVHSPTYRTKIYNNIIHNCSSTGITCRRGMMDAEIYNNLLYDNHLNIRMHLLNDADDLGRRVYIYSNVMWNPAEAGAHFYAHNGGLTTPAKFPVFYIYNNECVGGGTFLKADDMSGCGGMPEFYFFNNKILAETNYVTAFIKTINSEALGMYDYNAHGEKKYDIITGEIFGDHNVFFLKENYGYCDFKDINDFLQNYDPSTYEINWFNFDGAFNPSLPYSENRWIY